MKQLPTTIAERSSLHARGSDEVLKIILPGEPDEWRQLWGIFWSFDEKPYPVGAFEVRVPGAVPLTLFKLDIPEAGLGSLALGADGPVLNKGTDIELILHGKASRKEFSVSLR